MSRHGKEDQAQSCRIFTQSVTNFFVKMFSGCKPVVRIVIAPSPEPTMQSGQWQFFQLGMMEQVLSVLYGASGVAASALYVPQIMKYHRDRDARMSISLLAWSGWIVLAAITVLYALFVVRNSLIAMVAGLNILAQLTVLLYGINARMNKGRDAVSTSPR